MNVPRLEMLGALRSHQNDAYSLAIELLSAASTKRVTVASVTPGGGKTLMASIFTHVLLGGNYVDQVVVICPRDSLRTQFRGGFTERARGLTYRIAALGNKSLGQQSLLERAGYVTTYQAVVKAIRRHLRYVKLRRTLVILDEPQHLSDADRRSWREAVAPLVDAATHVLLMSGTLWRHDRAPIPFVPYDGNNEPIADIKYSRRDALEEKAILPVSVSVVDGRAEYWHAFKRHMVPSLREASKSQESKVLNTLLAKPEYRNEMVTQALAEWMKYRETVYPSRAIVLCRSQKDAREIKAMIKARFHVDVCLAISDEGAKAKRSLEDFRDRHIGEVLVTVGMAYEGLDVPDCTHLVCLTNFRSWPWLEQAFARVTRVNRRCGVPYERQHAYLYVPSDSQMLAYLDGALAEQDARCEVKEETPGGTSVSPRRSTFSPIAGETNGVGIFATDEGVMSEDDSEMVSRLMREFPLTSAMDVRQRLALARGMYSHKPGPGVN